MTPTTLPMPDNYRSFWMESDMMWTTQAFFIGYFGPITSLNPSHTISFLFKNNNLLEQSKTYLGIVQDTPELIRVYVELDIKLGWLEIIDFEAISSFWPGCETTEEGEYLGELESARKLKQLVIDRYFELHEEHQDNYYNDDDFNDEFPSEPHDRWGRDDFAYSAEERA